MIPFEFDYRAPSSIEEAVKLLDEEEHAMVLAGGHGILPDLKMRRIHPAMLVDLRKIELLHGIVQTSNGLKIGAMMTYAEIANNSEVKERYSLLAQAASVIGDTQVRHRGTMGGNVAYNHQASDLPAVLLALGAKIDTIGPRGMRSIAADAFFVGPAKTALYPNEIITSVELPDYAPLSPASSYEKFKNRASSYALCGIAVWCLLGNENASNWVVQECRIAVTGAVDFTHRLKMVEAELVGKEVTRQIVQSATNKITTEGLAFYVDRFASAQYRAQLAVVLTQRALFKAFRL